MTPLLLVLFVILAQLIKAYGLKIIMFKSGFILGNVFQYCDHDFMFKDKT